MTLVVTNENSVSYQQVSSRFYAARIQIVARPPCCTVHIWQCSGCNNYIKALPEENEMKHSD
jgi:hypothetical protein